MNVKEFNDYLTEEISSGRIDGNAMLCAEYNEDVCEVEGVYVLSGGHIHIQTGDRI